MQETQLQTLNAGQEAAATGFFEFLFSDKKELNISGPGGYGKTFLLGHMIDTIMPRYFETCKMMGLTPIYTEVAMTATTNKAAQVLSKATGREAQTIHSFLSLKVTDDYTTGKSRITRTKGWKVHEGLIIFVDEASMIDYDLYRYINEGTNRCKIVYVGDQYQLGPVMEETAPVYSIGLPIFELTEPMRNAEQPALMNLCNQLRETVKTGIFQPICLVPGVIERLDEYAMPMKIRDMMMDQNHESRILAYTNNRVIAYNDHIREMRQLPDEYQVGDRLINNNAYKTTTRMISVEEELTLWAQEGQTSFVEIEPGVQLEVRETTLQSALGGVFSTALPVDREHFHALIKYYARKKDWGRYFKLKGEFMDLRPRDASTIHKSQGSTYDHVFIDLGNLSTCTQPKVVARLLYVAASRARKGIYLFGELSEKYGGVQETACV